MRNKLQKLISGGFILITLLSTVGFLSSANQAEAQQALGDCKNLHNTRFDQKDVTQDKCTADYEPWKANGKTTQVVPLGDCKSKTNIRFNQKDVTQDKCTSDHEPWVANGKTINVAPGTVPPAPTNPGNPNGKSVLGDNLPDCGVIIDGTLDGCLVKLIYLLFYSLPAFLLTLAASLFDIVVPLALSSVMYTASDFIPTAWAVVRDISNIFFILILLYVAIQTILGVGGHGGGPKKMIAQIIIMALLINFSMFFSKVVIDTGNILALIFYNKINVETQGKTPIQHFPTLKGSMVGIQDKPISGGIMKAFDPSRMMTQEFFTKAKKQTQSVGMSVTGTAAWTAGGAYVGTAIGLPIIGTAIGAGVGYGASKIIGYFITSNEIPTPLMLGIIITTGLVMGYAAYAFFMASLAFVSRLIELWALIIFSPFAFMSSALPILSHVETIGWESWSKKIISTSFMAPVFMFFIYLIFKLVNTNVFQSIADRSFENQGTLEALVLIIIPALIILKLLMKATEYAKKASGEIGQGLLSVVKTAAVLGLGGAALGGAALARGTIKSQAKFVQNDTARRNVLEFKDTKAKWKEAKDKLSQPGVFNKISAVGSGISAATKGFTNITTKLAPAVGAEILHRTPAGKDASGNKTTWGKRAQKADESYGKQTHAKHVLDEKTKSELHKKDLNYDDLSEKEAFKVRKAVDKDQLAKQEHKTDFKGIKDDVDRAKIDKRVENAYTNYESNRTTGRMDEDDAQTQLKADMGLSKDSASELVDNSKANAAIGEFLQALRKASYDIRNLPNASSKNGGFMSKTTVATLATGAAIMRATMKKGGVDLGKSEGSFLKDLGAVIAGSLKNIKVDVSDVTKAATGHGGGGGGGGHH